MTQKTFLHVGRETVKGDAIHQLADSAAGCYEINVLRLAADVVDRETITVEDKVYELVQINTDTGSNSTVLDSTATDNVSETITAHGLSVGAVLRCENEYLQVVSVTDANTVVLSRGAFGSTVASHTDGSDIFEKEATALTAGAYTVPVGATLTPAAAGPEIATALNTYSLAGFVVEYNTNELFFYKPAVDDSTAFAETLSGVDNVVSATSYGGYPKGSEVAATVARVPTATEVALGAMRFHFGFDVKFVRVTVQATADLAAVAWDGAVAVTGGRVEVDNSGAVDWSASHRVTVEVHGNG